MKNIEKDLSLALLYLSGWEDEIHNKQEKIYRSWKGYKFDVLNNLVVDKMIRLTRESKSVIMTPEGIMKAQELIEKINAALGPTVSQGKS